MRRSLLTVAFLLAMPCATAGDVYRWADASGVVHFSDAPPPKGTPFKIMDMQTGVTRDPAPATAASSAATTTATAATADTAADQPATVKDTPANRAKLCSSLQTNIDLLSSDQPLTVNATSTEPLSAEDRATQLAAAQAQLNQYCEK